MAKKIFLSPSNQDGNKYAYGNTTEDVQCGRIAVALKSALEWCGFEVKMEQYDTMQNRVAHSNAWGADMHIAIHTNATEKHNAGGTQVFYYAENGYGNVACKAVFNQLKSITPGSNAEACRQYSTLYEVYKPNATSVYVEAEFHDVPEYAKWIIEHTTEIAEAICKGICAYFGVTYKAAAPAVGQTLYRIQVGAFAVRSNAEAYLKKVQAAGFPGAFITTVQK